MDGITSIKSGHDLLLEGEGEEQLWSWFMDRDMEFYDSGRRVSLGNTFGWADIVRFTGWAIQPIKQDLHPSEHGRYHD